MEKVSSIVKCSIFLLTFCLVAGCSSKAYVHQESSYFGFGGESRHHTRRDWVISEKAVIMVAPLREDATSASTRILNQRWLVEELEKSFSNVLASSASGSIERLFSIASANRAHYLLVPSVTNESNQLNGLPELLDNPKLMQLGRDRIAIKMLLYDVYARSLIDATLV